MIRWFVSALALVVLGYFTRLVRQRGLDLWVLPYLLQGPRRLPPPGEPIHVLICIADHFEPRVGGASPEVARARVERWVSDYPARFGGFRDSDGRTPRHTFFFPIEEYDPEHLDALAELCRAGFGEVELHLHHDNDTAENLRKTLLAAQELFAGRHGLLPRDRRTGQPAYGFVHGNWALDNSRPDGRWCGVNNELDVLRETGCYADFTFPSAPSRTQPRKVNSIYYAIDDPDRPRSHDRGTDVGTRPAPPESLMLIQGPLVLDWRRRRLGLIPRPENGRLQASQPPHIARLDLWLKAARPGSHPARLVLRQAPRSWRAGEQPCGHARRTDDAVPSRPGRSRPPRPEFSLPLRDRAEMYNLVKAAEEGWKGTVAEALDYHLVWDARISINQTCA